MMKRVLVKDAIRNQVSLLGFKPLFIRVISLGLLGLFPFMGFAQSAAGQSVEMAETFRESGKIYVVILVIAILFTGLFIFALRTERKLTKLEKEVKDMKIGEKS